MVKTFVKFILAFALISLLVHIFPCVGQWLRTAIMWLLSLGYWGAIGIFALLGVVIFNTFE